MTTGQLIPGVSNNELVRTTWGNFVAAELNLNSLKLNGLVPGTAGPSATPQVMTGGLYVRPSGVAAGVHVQNGSNQPTVAFESTAGTVLGHVTATTSGLLVVADVGTMRFLLGAVEVAELSSGLLAVTGAGRFGSTAGNQVQVVDINGGGDAALANVAFYPAATGLSTLGTRGAYVGYSGEGFQCQANGNAIFQSVAGNVALEAGGSITGFGDTVTWRALSGDVALFGAGAASAITFTAGNTFRGMMNEGGTFLWSKSASDLGNAGVEMYGVGTAEGRIASTVDDATAINLLLRHEAGANADNKHFASFYAGSSLIGRVEQNGASGVAYITTSDHRNKTVVGPIVDAVDRLKALKPWRVTWNDDPARGETDAFLAHEVTPVIPDAVSGTLDEVDDDGAPVMQGVDYSKPVPLLVAALQSALASIDDLTARVAALEVTP